MVIVNEGFKNLQTLRRDLFQTIGIPDDGVSRGITLECHPEHFDMPFRTEVLLVNKSIVAFERNTTEKRLRDLVHQAFSRHKDKINIRYVNTDNWCFTPKRNK